LLVGIQIIIQFNSVHVYLCANLTAQRPITKLAGVYRIKIPIITIIIIIIIINAIRFLMTIL
jgi:hypothetical protein